MFSRPGGFRADQLQFECNRDAARDLVLQGEQVARVAVEALGPDMCVGHGIDQLCADADLLARPADGAFEVAENGDLANWTTDDPGFPPGVGGAMDLAVGAKEIRVLVEHTTKSGAPRVRKRCEYPLTAAGAVSRIYTDLAVIDVTPDGLIVREIAEDIDFAALQAKTEATLRPAPDLKPLRAPSV